MAAPRRRPRGGYAKSAERRAEILEAAIQVFSASGYHKGSLRDVAELVGMSQAGLLHHFPSKNHLLEAVLGWRDEDSMARLGAERREGLDFIRALVELAVHNQTTPELVELHVVLSAEATSPEHPAHEYFMRRYARVISAVQRAFEKAAANDQLCPGVDCAGAARTLIALMDGLQVQWLIGRPVIDMPAELRRYLRPLLAVEL